MTGGVTGATWRIRLDEACNGENYKSIAQVVFLSAGQIVGFAANVDSTSDSGHRDARTAFYAFDGFEGVVSHPEKNERAYCSDDVLGSAWAAVTYSAAFCADAVRVFRPTGIGGAQIAPEKFGVEVYSAGCWASVLEVADLDWSVDVSKTFSLT